MDILHICFLRLSTHGIFNTTYKIKKIIYYQKPFKIGEVIFVFIKSVFFLKEIIADIKMSGKRFHFSVRMRI